MSLHPRPSAAGAHTPAREQPAPAEEWDVAGVDIRDLSSHADFHAAVAMQKLTWGEEYRDVVPASILKVCLEVGGVALGAFAPDGDMAGFVFGLTGPRNGALAHWSHMLGVAPRWRNRGVGSALKLAQARRVARAGVPTMHWTFDPLVARNAHLNLNHLGVRVSEYVPEMYGDTGSPAHSFGTDRFVTTWDMDRFVDDEDRGSPASAAVEPLPLRACDAPVLGPGDDASGEPPGEPLVRVAVPWDVEGLAARSLEDAREWRRRSRSAFQRAFAAGYSVVGFQRNGKGSPCHYVLRRDEGDARREGGR